MPDETTEKKLTPAQRKAIEALLVSGNTTEAAKAAGVNRVTLYRWRNDPAFAEALRDAEAEALAGLSRSLAGLADGVAAALRDALAPGQKISVRLRASEIVIDRLLRLRELVEVERRLAVLEGEK